MQLPPSASLSIIVKPLPGVRIWKGDPSELQIIFWRNPGIVFHLKIRWYNTRKNICRQYAPKSFVYGQITHYNWLMSRETGYVVVVLEPYSIMRWHVSPLTIKWLYDQIRRLFGQDALDLEIRF